MGGIVFGWKGCCEICFTCATAQKWNHQPPPLDLNPLNPLGCKPCLPVSTNTRAIVIIRVRDLVDAGSVRKSSPVILPLPGRSTFSQEFENKFDNIRFRWDNSDSKFRLFFIILIPKYSPTESEILN